MNRPIIQKLDYWRSEKYLAWIKKQPCVVTGLPADDPHHAKNTEWYGSVKGPDWATIPLTREQHNRFHHIGWQTWESLHGSQYEHIAKTLGKAISEGFFKEAK